MYTWVEFDFRNITCNSKKKKEKKTEKQISTALQGYLGQGSIITII